jgi:hypothetical protein
MRESHLRMRSVGRRGWEARRRKFRHRLGGAEQDDTLGVCGVVCIMFRYLMLLHYSIVCFLIC